MELDDAVYLGLRGPQLPSGHGGPTVVGVRDGRGQRTLSKHADHRMLADAFESGYRGAGPDALAEAILADSLGFNPDPPVSESFEREVVARLESEFELSAADVDDWLTLRIAAARTAPPTT